jgi:hypothetical protein
VNLLEKDAPAMLQIDYTVGQVSVGVDASQVDTGCSGTPDRGIR